MTAQLQLDSLQDALVQLRSGSLGIPGFSVLARGQHALSAALPERFDEVLQQLIDRLESSALFTDESCSFSHTDLTDSLQLWIDKAAVQLGKD